MNAALAQFSPDAADDAAAQPVLARPEVRPTRLDALLARIEPVAATLELPARGDRRGLLRSEAAQLVDRLLTRVARCRGALDLLIGDDLAVLATGDRTLQLGYSGLSDYARERLGIAGRTALVMAQLSRGLRDRPLLREAVRRGEITARKALTILPLARGEAELEWTRRARTATVRSLEAAVRQMGTTSDEAETPWDRVCLTLVPTARERLDEAMELAAEALGPTSTRWERLEAMCQEYLGSHPAPEGSGEADVGLTWSAQHAPDLREILEDEASQWEFLDPVDPIAAPEELAVGQPSDPHALDARLRHLVALRSRWDELVGHLGMLLRSLGLWRDMLFASFEHYCAERLGMAGRTVEQRVALERRLYALPALRTALRAGRVSYEQARVISEHADDSNLGALIARAERTPAIRLRRELEGEREAQMCARSEFELRLPRPVGAVLGSAFSAVRSAVGSWVGPGECLHVISVHCIATWSEGRPRRRNKVRDRDRGLCQVPGCSRAGGHVHHIVYRSHGGDESPDNLVTVCAAHHLHAIHRGWIRVFGRAPSELHWQLATAPAPPPVRGSW